MIDSFRGEYAFLSNFHPCGITLDGIYWETVEHYYQASKTLDKQERLFIANCIDSPGGAKRYGRSLKIRSDWEEVKEGVMLTGLREKFKIPSLRKKLIATGSELLVEGNWWHDNYWGNCTCPRCSKIKGKNRLGVLIMVVREEIFGEEIRKEILYGKE